MTCQVVQSENREDVSEVAEEVEETLECLQAEMFGELERWREVEAAC